MPHVNLNAYAVTFVSHFAMQVRMLSLGAGTGDSELAVARRASLSMEITLHAVVEDANAILIPQLHNDLIVRRRSLHHIVELEHILAQIKSGMSPEGEFLVMGEVIGRNRLMLYPETEQVAQAICLPPRLWFNHYTKQVDEVVPNIDHSQGSFEATRSKGILPLLTGLFAPIEHVSFDACVSLLLGWRYGPNCTSAS